jgi:hypothetical protein
MPHVKYDTSNSAGATPEARIANRLKPSCDIKHADHYVVKGTGPTRTASAIHESGNHVAPRNVRDVNIREAAKQKAPRS